MDSDMVGEASNIVEGDGSIEDGVKKSEIVKDTCIGSRFVRRAFR